MISRVDEGVENRVKLAIDQNITRQKSALEGNVDRIAGSVLWRLSLKGDPSREAVEDSGVLDTAIDYTRRSVESLNKADAERAWDSKNNHAYFLALRGKPGDRRSARELAAALFKRHLESRDYYYLLTYIRVLLQYPETLAELKEAEELLKGLKEAAPGDMPAEAGEYVESYLNVLDGEVEGQKLGELASHITEFCNAATVPSPPTAPPSLGQAAKTVWDALKEWFKNRRRSGSP